MYVIIRVLYWAKMRQTVITKYISLSWTPTVSLFNIHKKRRIQAINKRICIPCKGTPPQWSTPPSSIISGTFCPCRQYWELTYCGFRAVIQTDSLHSSSEYCRQGLWCWQKVPKTNDDGGWVPLLLYGIYILCYKLLGGPNSTQLGSDSTQLNIGSTQLDSNRTQHCPWQQSSLSLTAVITVPDMSHRDTGSNHLD